MSGRKRSESLERAGSGIDPVAGEWTAAFDGQRRPFERGHQLSVVHGAAGELTVAPLRTAVDVELAAEFPELHPLRRSILADRIARLTLARRFVDAKGGVISDPETGAVWPVLDRVSKWESVVDATLRELEQERAQSHEAGAVERLIAAGRETRGGGR